MFHEEIPKQLSKILFHFGGYQRLIASFTHKSDDLIKSKYDITGLEHACFSVSYVYPNIILLLCLFLVS